MQELKSSFFGRQQTPRGISARAYNAVRRSAVPDAKNWSHHREHDQRVLLGRVGAIVLTATLLLFGVPAVTPSAQAEANDVVGLIISTTNIAVQGDCSAAGQPDTRGQSADRSTISCPGAATQSLSFAFSNGTSESCLYIDNSTGGFGRHTESFFVPMNSVDEWQKFKESTQAGSLFGDVSLVYGCKGASVSSPCGTAIQLPDARNGHTETVAVTANMSASYTCVALSGCGTWNLTSTSGHCPVNGACGVANGVGTRSPPASNFCDSGTASAIAGSGPWLWTCNGQYGGTSQSCSATKITDGACGAASGVASSAAPSSGLCSAGTASTISGSGPWDWTCAGDNGGVTTSCGASRSPPSCSPTWSQTGRSACSASCGGGTLTVSWSDSCGSSDSTSEACNTQACPCVQDGVSYPTGRGECNVACGGGLRSLYWRTNCGDTWETQENCNTQACTGDSTCQQRIVSSGPCSTTCGGGIQTVQWDNGCGLRWSGTAQCNQQPCNGGGGCVVTGFGSAYATGPCSVTCGGGIQDVYFRDNCGGTSVQQQTCNITPCAAPACDPNQYTGNYSDDYATVCPAGAASYTRTWYYGCGTTRSATYSCQ